MEANELIKHAPEIARAATTVAATVPLTAIVKRMLGPAADELAEMWRDQVRLYRYERQLKCVEKAERMAQEAGFTPQAVPRRSSSHFWKVRLLRKTKTCMICGRVCLRMQLRLRML